MFFPESQVRIWLYTRATDMRKSFDGLTALVKHQLQEDPLSGQLFVFINRKRTYLKILYFDRSGYCIWSKRLERGHFNYSRNEGLKQLLDWTRLKLILEGIELDKVRQQRRYIHSSSRSVMIE
ncbi:MAG: IS66 family insertion sequence element accessory protein TnpB [Arenicellales bacterium]|jgi:transposase